MNKLQATKKNLLDTADHKHQAGDPYLKFSLMEVGGRPHRLRMHACMQSA